MAGVFRLVIRSLSTVAHYKPRPIVVSGPSGSGKSTLIQHLFNEYPAALAFSVSHTTRKPRPKEQNGREYHFVPRAAMEKMIENGDFLETTEFASNLYGTSKKAVEEVAKTGRICVLDVDKEGVKSIRKTDLRPLFIFVNAPSFAVLEQRLRSRKTDDEDDIERRLKEAKEAIEFAKQPGVYDHTVINDNLDIAYQNFKEVLQPDIDKVLQHQKTNS